MIKGKPGNMSKGTTSETLDGIRLEFFKKLSYELKKGNFKFTPTSRRRILIPKGPGKSGERPLSIAAKQWETSREKIVQKAVAVILEAIFEPLFLDTSHGFRPNRGTHTALKQLYIKGGNFN